MNYQQTLEYLYNSLPVFQRIGAAAYKSNLDNTLAMDAHTGHPHREFATIHIAGTNGKGSTSQMIYEVLRAHGLKVGLYTSPHLTDFRERIIVDDQMISQDDVVGFVERNREFIDKIQPSFFEVTVAMAFDHFSRQQVDIAVVEVGMGGRLDSTNIISPLLSIITNIDYDHTQFLGTTLPEIAAEKAGIIKEETPVVIGESSPETALVFIEQARRNYSPIVFADQRYRCSPSAKSVSSANSSPSAKSAANPGNRLYEVTSLMEDFRFEVELSMGGDYQQKNLCTVLTALDILSQKIRIEPDKVRAALARARVRGRWQQLGQSPAVICDTGHNVAGIRYIVEQLSRQTYDKLFFVIGMVNDKDISNVLSLLPKDAHYIFTRADIPRALAAEQLAETASRIGLHGELVKQPSEPGTVGRAIERARELASPGDLIFIGGSTFVVADALGFLGL